jgi:hypothetical protein
VYLLPNIEFVFCPIKSLQFGPSKLLSFLEGKNTTPSIDINMQESVNRSGYLSIDGRNKLLPYLCKDIKNKPISGLWVYNDTIEHECKGKNATNELLSKVLDYRLWTH